MCNFSLNFFLTQTAVFLSKLKNWKQLFDTFDTHSHKPILKNPIKWHMKTKKLLAFQNARVGNKCS